MQELAVERAPRSRPSQDLELTGWRESLHSYVFRIAGRDRTWKRHGLCGTEAVLVYQGAFLCGEDEQLIDDDNEMITGYQAQRRVVEQFCLECPVQWECARWGVEVNEEVGVYSITTHDRRWLMRLGDRALAVIDAARVDGIPVQIAVQAERHDTRPEV